NARPRSQVVLVDRCLGGNHNCGGAIVEARRVASGDDVTEFGDWAQLRQGFNGRAGARTFILIHDGDVAFTVLDFHRDDFGIKPAGFLSGYGFGLVITRHFYGLLSSYYFDDGYLM